MPWSWRWPRRWSPMDLRPPTTPLCPCDSTWRLRLGGASEVDVGSVLTRRVNSSERSSSIRYSTGRARSASYLPATSRRSGLPTRQGSALQVPERELNNRREHPWWQLVQITAGSGGEPNCKPTEHHSVRRGNTQLRTDFVLAIGASSPQCPRRPRRSTP
jgi:hypothetical protein